MRFFILKTRANPLMSCIFAFLFLLLSSGFSPSPALAGMPPLEVKILDPQKTTQGKAFVYFNYIELEDASGDKRGAIGVMMVQGRAELFLVRADNERVLVGYAKNYRLYNTKNQLVGYYYWTPIWSYAYDPRMKKVGQAQCLAYQGVCAAGIAGFLLGLY